MKGVAMTPKDVQPQMLYFSAGGEYKPLGRITEVPEMVVGDEDFEQEMLEFQYPEEMTFTATTIMNSNLILLLLGRKENIPNNWLKMHGYPMRRKVGKRK